MLPTHAELIGGGGGGLNVSCHLHMDLKYQKVQFIQQKKSATNSLKTVYTLIVDEASVEKCFKLARNGCTLNILSFHTLDRIATYA